MPRLKSAKSFAVPYLHKKQIEREAELLLAEYAEQMSPVVEPPVPLEELAGGILPLNLGFVDLQQLFECGDVHGAIWFEEGRVAIDHALNPDAHPNRRGRYHFTVAHEFGHWRLHRQHYLENKQQRELFPDGSVRPDVVCRSSQRREPVEWQADQFAACLLMPRRVVYAAWADFHGDDAPATVAEIQLLHPEYSNEPVFHRGRVLTSEQEKTDALKEAFCKPLADRFEVSPEAMRIRLEELELIVQEKPRMLF